MSYAHDSMHNVGLEATPVLRLEHVSKTFSGVRALSSARFELRSGEVHALMGENGAGKSTLIKILGGIYQPDSAEIYVSGERCSINGVKGSQRLGISIVHQELILAEEMTVAENMFLGKEPKNRFGFVDSGRMAREAATALRRFAVDIDPNARISALSLGQKQIVEIAKALLNDARIIIMDEPTASLTKSEVEKLYGIVQTLKEHGCSIIYVSHRMEEIFALSDRITVFRDGQYIATLDTASTSADELIRLMVGRELREFYRAHNRHDGGAAIEVRDLTRGSQVRNVSFAVAKGEVLGFYGLIGAGRTELARVLFGIDRKSSGEILLDGASVSIDSPAEAIALGIALAPESRKEHGLVLGQTAAFNITIAVIRLCQRLLFVSRSKEMGIAEDYIRRLGVKVSSPHQMVSKLSGGNQQKIVLAKWLATAPKVLILDEPTRGIDVGAKAEIYRLVSELADAGMAIIFISSDLPEVMHISDALCVMHNGTITARIQKEQFSEERILSSASGVDHV